MDLFFILIDDMFFAAIPAVGFALIFNVPKKALKYCAILGAIGHGFRSFLVYVDIPLVFSTFFAATLIGFAGVYISKRYLAHPKVFTVAAVIPMIPGVPAYRSMIAIVQINHYGSSPQLFSQMVDNFVQTGFLLGALVFGLALPGLLFYRHRPVV
ncbi:threonine/serine exporter family protein [Phocoenobacter skyensis]|nr:threonine/serine exporter family protein [Pasteurella skyensis]MDP8079070.1 threonine/serine exporter family protein [Pasteurella skyensis]MDP8085020.1 threonine/serine exporter family protein [Pasteurella skyensis]MDP8170667.1 threonine/serine exporter family protein [Pasteurella skyensis]MDP8174852.1 threonine/serine exporter family protein [Pasteurella skyensis]MDP8184941.1 threonine/serine exporter family protein [Pasteurella skyensis]